jgi:SOS-response transcriptional repressor LexA
MDAVRLITLREAVDSLTKAQRRIYDHIIEHTVEHGSRPTFRELETASGISLSTVHFHVQAMKKKGVLLPGYGERPYGVAGLSLDVDSSVMVEVTDGEKVAD